MQSYALLAARGVSADEDALVDRLCELELLPATDTPATPIGALAGTRVLTAEFEEVGARALAFWRDCAVLVDFALCARLLSDPADADPDAERRVRALSQRYEILVASARDEGLSLRVYHAGALARDRREPASASSAIAAEIHAFVGGTVDEIAARAFAVYDTELAPLRRLGVATEWGRGVGAVLVPDATGQELAIAEELVGGKVSLQGDSLTALEASHDHGFRDLTALGAEGGIAMVYPGYFRLDRNRLDPIAAALARHPLALLVRWSQRFGEVSWFAILEHGAVTREMAVESDELSAFERELRGVVRDVLGVSLTWLFGPAISLVRIDVAEAR
jgi:hypothetical protein